MSDIVERLRHCSENCGDEYLHELAGRAADTIAALTAEVQMWKDVSATNARLTARVKELEAALKEIAYFADGTPRKNGPYFAAHIASAALSASQPSPSPWMPIETAPKDGTEFWAYSQDLSGNGLSSFQSRCAWHPDAGFCTDEIREPTHWMPLPPAPQKEGAR
jgi:hypothetical protein